MALVKVSETVLYALANTAAATISLGTALDVSTYYAVHIRLRFGRTSATAFTLPPEIRIEGSHKIPGSVSAVNEADWIPLWRVSPNIGLNIGSQAVSGTSNASDATLLLVANTNFASGDYLFIHNTTLANSEWKRTNGLSTNTFTLQEGLFNAQTSSTARNQAEDYQALLDTTPINSLRVVVNNQGGGQSMAVEAGLSAVSSL